MRNLTKFLVALAVIAGVVMIGVIVGWWGGAGQTGSPNSPMTGSNSDVAAAQPNAGVAVAQTNPRPPRPTASSPAARRTNSAPSPLAAATTTNPVPDWEDKVDAILSPEGEDSEKAKKLLELFPRLSEEGQEEVAHHLSNLVSDEDYAPLGKYLTTDTLAEAVLDVLMEDVLNRPNAIKLPVLLEVARDPQNPKSSEAKDVLELFLEEDYGTDWPKWQAKMDQWLKENPD